MFFRYEFTAKGLWLEEGKPTALKLDDTYQTVIEIKKAPSNTTPSNEASDRAPKVVTLEQFNQGNRGEATGIISCEKQTQDKIAAVFSRFLEAEPGVGFHGRGTRPMYISTDGNILDNNLPGGFQKFRDSILRHLFDMAERVVGVIRWRLARVVPHRGHLFDTRVSWAMDGEQWHPWPLPYTSVWDASPLASVTDEAIADIERLVRQDNFEPTAHELFLDAWQIRRESPRSALVLGITSAELGIKRCISLLIPHAEWIVMNLDTPDIVRIIQTYFKKLADRGLIPHRLLPPEEIVKTIKVGRDTRNILVHSEPPEITLHFVSNVLMAVRNLLWLLDAYVGDTWALAHVDRLFVPVRRPVG